MDLLLIIIIIFVPLIAQIGITRSYNNYKNIKNSNNLTGASVARTILDNNGLQNVKIEKISGDLTDHYDPRTKVVRLSESIYDGQSVSSTAVAAHECGHAIQDSTNYIFLKIRSAIYPVVNVATSISYWIILFGFLFELLDLVYIGIAFTCLGLLFQIVTLPVEFNASSRAIAKLNEYHLIDSNENYGTKKVLTAAAMTYIAGVLASAVQILRLVLIARDRS